MAQVPFSDAVLWGICRARNLWRAVYLYRRMCVACGSTVSQCGMVGWCHPLILNGLVKFKASRDHSR